MRIFVDKSYFDGGPDQYVSCGRIYDVIIKDGNVEFEEVKVKIPKDKYVDFSAPNESDVETVSATFEDLAKGRRKIQELYEEAIKEEPLYFQYMQERKELDKNHIIEEYSRLRLRKMRDSFTIIPETISKPYCQFFARWPYSRRQEFKEIAKRTISIKIVPEKDPDAISQNEFLKMFNIDKIL